MAVLESCPKHNMVAYLEKTEGNAELMRHIDAKKIKVSPYGKKGKHFSGKVTPLFASMLVQSTEDEGATSERPSDPQPTPSPPHPKSFGGNHGGQSSSDKSLSGNEGDMTLQSVYDLCISLCTQVTDQAKEIKHLKAQIKKLKKKAKPVITHHRAWMKSGRKSAKAKPSVHKYPLFDELPEDTLDYMETEDAQDVGRTREVVNEEKETVNDEVSTEDVLSTAQQKEKDSTINTDEGTVDQTEGRRATPTTPTTTPTMFGDDETIAQVLLNMSQAKAVSREKDKGVELKDGKIEEEDESKTESKGIPEAEKKFKQLARDEEMARKLQEDWETEEERKRLAEEETTKTALSDEYDFIQARIEADRLLALRLQDEERESSSLNKPPTRTQLRNQMMTYLKHVGNKKHSDLKSKTFEEIQALYEKVKRFDESFTVVGSTEDERRIKEMNERVKDTDQKRLKEEDTAKVPAKDWKIVTWRLYEACRVYILKLEDGAVIHMLVKRRYPLSKDLLQKMLDLGLEVERESTTT
ncbi:hypothetical protein Tco_0747953 [Tanacetum coccineum]|uniref:Uncharacterized protein n=1 Tax=Tanacetum coccineum TaxID=301880 RepID=A0ABQ4YWY4_9ASTR